jgi:hypothetical protein
MQGRNNIKLTVYVITMFNKRDKISGTNSKHAIYIKMRTKCSSEKQRDTKHLENLDAHIIQTDFK